jgi:hypothetical protein
LASENIVEIRRDGRKEKTRKKKKSGRDRKRDNIFLDTQKGRRD